MARSLHRCSHVEGRNSRANCDLAEAVGQPGADYRPHSVAEVMRREFITVSPDDSLFEAYQLMRLARLRHLVVARDGILEGILSYRDIQDEALSQGDESGDGGRDASLRGIPVSRTMVSLPYAVAPEAPLAEAAIRLCRLRLGCLSVVDQQSGQSRILGLLTESDLLRAAFDPWFRGVTIS